MNQVEVSKLIISQNGNCVDVLCDNCPAEKTRQKLNVNSCNDIWGGDRDEYCKRWFENWLKEQEEKNMSDKIQMTEEQARDFCNDLGFADKETVFYLMKQRGYILKSELQQKVEEAEESWEHYRINCLSPDFESDDRDEIIIELHQAFIALKQSHPEFKK